MQMCMKSVVLAALKEQVVQSVLVLSFKNVCSIEKAKVEIFFEYVQMKYCNNNSNKNLHLVVIASSKCFMEESSSRVH